MSKYRAIRTEVDGITFDSKREAARYQELMLLGKAGTISHCGRQPTWDLEVNGQLICRYRADFQYLDHVTNKIIVEDVKSAFTRKDRVYRLKRKLMKAIHNIDIVEVM